MLGQEESFGALLNCWLIFRQKMAINTPMAVNSAEPVADEQEAEDNVSTFSTSDEMGVRNCFYDFCKQTILHGWHYLADLENEATPSPSFVTFTPISSPNATLTGKIN